jgi:predicted site-specific integrase-resolvase
MNIDFMINLRMAEEKPKRIGCLSQRWTREEDEFIRNNIAFLGHDGVAAFLGRSVDAVKIRRIRRGIPAASKRPGWLTGQDVARYLGVDIHSVMKWHQSGLFKFEVLPGERRIMMIRLVTLYRWATRPQHWIYFRVKNMRDFHLKRLVMRAQEIWGDKWLRIGQAAKLLGCDSKSLNMRVNRGKIPQARKNGNWYIPESVVMKMTFFPGKGGHSKGQKERNRQITRADRWMMHARFDLGMTYVDIAARMGPKWNAKRVSGRLKVIAQRPKVLISSKLTAEGKKDA